MNPLQDNPGALPLAPIRRERRDAARNRQLVLEAAERLFAERGVDCVRMEDVATEAGVGKGTLYRAFGDKSTLVFTLLDEHERDFQDAILRGPPPLGPGVDPRERLEAFLHALIDLVGRHLNMLLVGENSPPGARYRVGAYAAWRLHVAVLLRQARPDLDAEWHAEALLAPLAADLYRHQTEELGFPPERIKAGLSETVRVLLATGCDHGGRDGSPPSR